MTGGASCSGCLLVLSHQRQSGDVVQVSHYAAYCMSEEGCLVQTKTLRRDGILRHPYKAASVSFIYRMISGNHVHVGKYEWKSSLRKPGLLLWTCAASPLKMRHNAENSRSIATAAPWFVCSYDMWVWWGWLSGCMTAKSVLLSTAVV